MECERWFDLQLDRVHYCPRHGLSRAGRPIPLGSQQAELLELLLERPGELVSREEIKKRIWGDRSISVGDNSLNELVSSLRRVLGDSARPRRFIETLKNTGYRLKAPLLQMRGQCGASGRSTELTTVSLSARPTGIEGLRPGRFVVVMAVLLALHNLAAEAAEAVFIFGHMHSFALIAPLNALCVFVASSLGMRFDWSLSQRSQASGLAASLGCATLALVVVALISWPFLPDQLDQRIASVGWPPRAGFLKSAIIYPAILAAVFIHFPFHIVATLAAEISKGQLPMVLSLLAGDREAVAPAATVFVKPLWLGVTLALLGGAGIPMTLHLLGSLDPGSAASSLFSQLVLIRFLSWWGTAVIAWWWYKNLLDYLKRTARFLSDGAVPTEQANNFAFP
jgi:DNA-binding winged helix-turn-helix (wHTH) protein